MKIIKTTINEFDRVRTEQIEGHCYFTVGKGKATYDLLHIPDGGCGLHYVFRTTTEGLTARRALEPTTEITIYLTHGI